MLLLVKCEKVAGFPAGMTPPGPFLEKVGSLIGLNFNDRKFPKG